MASCSGDIRALGACGTCRDLFTNPVSRDAITSPGGMTIHRPLRALKAAAASGCLLCERILTWFELETAKWNAYFCPEVDGVTLRMYLPLLIGVLCVYVEGEAVPATTEGKNWLSFMLFTTSDDPAAAVFRARLGRGHDVASEESFRWARERVQHCIQHHEACTMGECSKLPTRVLDVGGSGPPKLIATTHGDSAPYACLSYCWGARAQPVVTTLATLQQHMNHGVTGLPRSIEDAVTSTRRLGLRYLWVDALCIIQDSEEDKMQEIARMGDIYEDATVTIVAASAASCVEGFLQFREPWTVAGGPRLTLPYLCPDGSVGTVFLRLQTANTWFREPIDARAWTMQEYMLPRRLLYYGTSNLYWSCRSEYCGQRAGPAAGQVSGVPDAEPVRGHPLTGRGDAMQKQWKGIIEEYSRRSLTNADDKLPALSGLASRFHKIIPADYLAGLWRQWIHPHLLWYCLDDSRSRPLRGCPSWSWLSVDSPVGFLRDDSHTDVRLLGHVVVCRVTPVRDSAPFSHVHPGGYLKIRSHGKEVEPDWERSMFFGVDRTERVWYQPRIAEIRLDASRPPAELPRSVFCLALASFRAHDSRKVDEDPTDRATQGLVLEARSDGSYRRIGWFASDIGLERWFRNAELREVTIL